MTRPWIPALILATAALWIAFQPPAVFSQGNAHGRVLKEVNEIAPAPAGTIAIVGATLIDGLGGEPLPDAAVVVSAGRIVAAGRRDSVPIPAGAEVVDAAGLSILPGLIDAHFHRSGGTDLPGSFLARGVTSLRDPGAWIEGYDQIRQLPHPIPRLFLTGPHLDNFPNAHGGAFIVQDEDEARNAVNRFIDEGASAIKVYYRLPLGLIRVVAATAEARGVPVVAHLELVDVRDAMVAGLNGIEHVTSYGTALVSLRRAERFRQAVMADNEARRDGRYELWNEVDLQSPQVGEAIRLTAERGVFFSANLAVFERQAGRPNVTDVHVRAHRNMMEFVGMSHRGGVRVVVGSHSNVPYAERGWAYHREMELLVESGMSPLEVITAATIQNARFFRVQERLGSIEAGKLADLVLIEGNPALDITKMRQVRAVMLGGRWVAEAGKLHFSTP